MYVPLTPYRLSWPGRTLLRLVSAHLRLPRAAQPGNVDGGDRG